MSDIRTSFIYDPIRQGYDSNSWRTISGAPTVVAGRLSIDNEAGLAGSCIHYADFLKGDISFDVNVPVIPVGGVTRMFGVSAPNTSAYIRFSIGDTLVCETSDGINTTTSSAILWNSDWTGANVVFRIRWEPGNAKFFVGGTQVYAVCDDSVPAGPLSLYLFDEADSSMTVGDMNVRGTQSYVMNLKTSDTTPTNPTGKMSLSQNVTLTENVTMLITELYIPASGSTLFESVTVSENVVMKSMANEDFAETATITESVTMLIPQVMIPYSTGDMKEDVTVSENIVMEAVEYGDLAESVTITEDVAVSMSEDMSLYEDVVATEDVVLLVPEIMIPFDTGELYEGVTVSEGEVEMTRVVGP